MELNVTGLCCCLVGCGCVRWRVCRERFFAAVARHGVAIQSALNSRARAMAVIAVMRYSVIVAPCLCGCDNRLEARTGCVKRGDGGLEAAHCLGFSVLDAIVAACHSPGLRVVCDPRTLRECARAMTGTGVAGVYGDVGHASSQVSSQHFTVFRTVRLDTLAVWNGVQIHSVVSSSSST